MQTRQLLALAALLTLAQLSDGAPPIRIMGYQEGARRTVQCAGGGHVTGLDAWWTRTGGVSEPSVAALRIKCSTGKLDVEYGTAPVSDEQLFGRKGEGFTGPTSADCPAGTGVAAVEWRRAKPTEKEGTMRVAGFRVHCSSEHNTKPLAVDLASADQDYPSAVSCSGIAAPPAGDKYRLNSVDVWYDVVFTGLSFVSCTPEAA